VCIAFVIALLGEYVQAGYRREVWGKRWEKSREMGAQRGTSSNQKGTFTQELFCCEEGCECQHLGLENPSVGYLKGMCRSKIFPDCLNIGDLRVQLRRDTNFSLAGQPN